MRRAFRKAPLVSLAALFGFGLSHVAFITPLANPPEGTPLWMKLGVMLGAPMMIGAVLVAINIPLVALAWTTVRLRAGRLASWRFGAVLAATLVPPLLANALVRGDLPAPAFLAMFALQAALPAAFGARAAGLKGGILMVLATMPWSLSLTMFYVSTELNGWVLAFVACTLAVVVASGWLMERLCPPIEPAAPATVPSASAA